MKIKLIVLERSSLLGILPKEENYLTYKMIMDLKKDLSLSSEEWKECKGKNLPDGRITWEKDISKEINIPEVIEAMLIEKLKSLEKAKKINGENISLYEIFILNRTKSISKRVKKI